LARYRSTN